MNVRSIAEMSIFPNKIQLKSSEAYASELFIAFFLKYYQFSHAVNIFVVILLDNMFYTK